MSWAGQTLAAGMLAAAFGASAAAQPAGNAYLIKDFAPGPDPELRAASHGPLEGMAHRGKFYFEGSYTPTYDEGVGGTSIYPGMLVVSDGTTYGTLPLKTMDNLRFLGPLGDHVVFADSDFGAETGRRINVTDGSVKNTKELRLIRDAVEILPGMEAGGWYYFFALFEDGRTELWQTDGTVDGTRSAQALLPPGYTADASVPIAGWDASQLLLLAHDANGVGNLVLVNGGTQSARRIFSDNFLATFGAPDDFVVADGTILYRSGRRFFSSDGTETFTQIVGDLPLMEGASEEIRLIPADTRFFLLTNFTSSFYEVWSTDGSPGSLGLARRLDWSWSGAPTIGETATWNDKLYFTESGLPSSSGSERRGKLWVSDGTTLGTFELWAQLREIDGLLATTRGVIFGVDQSAGPPGLYITQGVAGETENLRPGYWRPLAETDSDGVPGGERLFLTGKQFTDTTYGRELWVSDWTDYGWYLPKDLSASGRTSVAFNPLGAFGRYVFFNDGYQGHVWITDGTEAGTQPIGSILGDFYINMAGDLDIVAEELQAILHGDLLIIYVRGIMCTNDECCGDGPDEDQSLLDFLNDLLEDDECKDAMKYVTSVWRTDGTLAGTYSTGVIENEWLWFPTTFNHRIMLYAQAFIDHDTEPPTIYPPGLWASTGTRATTSEVRTFPCNAENVADKGVSPFGTVLGEACSAEFIPLGNTSSHFFFSLREPIYENDPTQDRQLWVSDTTATGTFPLVPLLTADGISETIHLTGATYQDKFFFSPTIMPPVGSGSVPLVEGELWETNGTMAGTQRMTVVQWEGQDQAIRNLTKAGNYLFFTGNGGELWVSDGTDLFTLPMTYITGRESVHADALLGEVNGRLVFSSDGNLWSTDGTKFGTMRLPDAVRGPETAPIQEFTPIKDKPFAMFSSGTAATGLEMWYTDATASGTYPVFEMTPGPYSSHPRSYVGALGNVYFQASTPEGGNELWQLSTSQIKKPASSGWATRDIIIEFGKDGEAAESQPGGQQEQPAE
ncbi:MAG: hypothetical protein PWP23_833 [Candidatus Sumerlaeota bacterium]|nr:hypothetical protein [Candidatus Sumerlaeota bacterium]